jgi:hypothetical protein
MSAVLSPAGRRLVAMAALSAMALCPIAAHAGLDITAYERVSLVASPRLNAEGEPLDRKEVRLDVVHFPERAEGLTPGKVYRFQTSFEFRAGSYSGYSAWRNELAKLGGYPPTMASFLRGNPPEPRYDATAWQRKSGPFWELIAFSDAEGLIGPVTCQRVHADFIRFQPAAEKHPDAEFRESYADWAKAFRLCANGGAIVFH